MGQVSDAVFGFTDAERGLLFTQLGLAGVIIIILALVQVRRELLPKFLSGHGGLPPCVSLPHTQSRLSAVQTDVSSAMQRAELLVVICLQCRRRFIPQRPYIYSLIHTHTHRHTHTHSRTHAITQRSMRSSFHFLTEPSFAAPFSFGHRPVNFLEGREQRWLTMLSFGRSVSLIFNIYFSDVVEGSETEVEYLIFALLILLAVSESPLFLSIRAPPTIGLPIGALYSAYLFCAQVYYIVRCRNLPEGQARILTVACRMSSASSQPTTTLASCPFRSSPSSSLPTFAGWATSTFWATGAQ
jgi:hypothetical protein